MSQPQAYKNGQFIPADELAIDVQDTGFIYGATVSERLRTFRGQLFQWEHHLQRLTRSLEIVGIEEAVDLDGLRADAEELVSRNYRLVDPASDIGLVILVTPGISETGSSPPVNGPTIVLHTTSLPFRQIARLHQHGQPLVVAANRQVPATCWPAELKCRSRIHYYLADQSARQQQSRARALMLDVDGYVSETSSANIFIYNSSIGFISPPLSKVLPGITLAAIESLAGKMAIPFTYQDLTLGDLLAAEEVLLCSTTPCVWSASEINQQRIGDGRPGMQCRKLLTAWSEMVGVDIVQQALANS